MRSVQLKVYNCNSTEMIGQKQSKNQKSKSQADVPIYKDTAKIKKKLKWLKLKKLGNGVRQL